MQRIEMIGKVCQHLQAKPLRLPGNARLVKPERLVEDWAGGLAVLLPGTIPLESTQPCGFVHGSQTMMCEGANGNAAAGTRTKAGREPSAAIRQYLIRRLRGEPAFQPNTASASGAAHSPR